MIRNHLIDPESSPMKGQSSEPLPSYPLNNYQNNPNTLDDPWYTHSDTNSPSTNTNQNPSYSNYGYGGYMEPTTPATLSSYSNVEPEDYDNEPPLLEELGIRFDHIWSKTQAVIIPTKNLHDNILDDADLAGPLVYCLMMGAFLLLSGKVHFGYIYGFSVFGCLGMYTILNLLTATVAIDFWITCSVLGYCLLPVIGLAGLSVVMSLQSMVGVILATIVIMWSTHAATRLFDAKLALSQQYWLIAYPIMLLYSCFVIITIF